MTNRSLCKLGRILAGVTYTVVASKGQVPEFPAPAFEVVSVRPTGSIGVLAPDSNGRQFSTITPFRYTVAGVETNRTLAGLIKEAYQLEDWEIDGPAWIHSLTFQIRAIMPPNTSRSRARLMLGTVLSERFNLKFHYVKRDVEVYALTTSRKQAGSLREASGPGPPNSKMAPGLFMASGSMDVIAASLQTYSDKPLLNMTGLDGIYELEVHWTPEEAGPGRYVAAFWEALRRNAGLIIEKRRMPRNVLVIDHSERQPTPN